MENNNCYICDREVENENINKDDITELYFCNKCYKDKSNKINNTEAKKQFFLTSEELKTVPHNKIRNQYGKFTHVYSIKDVENRALKKYKTKEEIEKLRSNNKILNNIKAKKIEELKENLNRLNLQYKENDSILKDYIDDSNRDEFSLRSTLERYIESEYLNKLTGYKRILNVQLNKEFLFLIKDKNERMEEIKSIEEEIKKKCIDENIELFKNLKDIPFSLLRFFE